MQVTIHFFARARDLTGTPAVSLSLPEAATVGILRQELAQVYPALASLLEKSAVAVDNEYAEDDRQLSSSSQVALLPPVSGG